MSWLLRPVPPWHRPGAACPFAHSCRMAGSSLPQPMPRQRAQPPSPPIFHCVFSPGMENIAYLASCSAGWRRMSKVAIRAPNHETIPTDVCPSHYKSCSEERCHVPAKVSCSDKQLHTSPFHPKVPTCLCSEG